MNKSLSAISLFLSAMPAKGYKLENEHGMFDDQSHSTALLNRYVVGPGLGLAHSWMFVMVRVPACGIFSNLQCSKFQKKMIKHHPNSVNFRGGRSLAVRCFSNYWGTCFKVFSSRVNMFCGVGHMGFRKRKQIWFPTSSKTMGTITETKANTAFQGNGKPA